MKFSMIVPTLGRPASVLVDLLDSLAALGPERGRRAGELVLADQNTPPLDLAGWARGRRGFRYQRIDASRGLPRRRSAPADGVTTIVHLVALAPSVTRSKNLAVAASRFSQLLFLDDDVVLLPGCLDAHAGLRRRMPGLGCLGGRETVDPPELRRGRARDLAALVMERLLGGRRGEEPYKWEGHYVGRVTAESFFLCEFDVPADPPVRVDTVRGCHWSLSREAFDAAGGFDPRFHGTAMREESDLHLRVRDAGYLNWFTGTARVIHRRKPGGCGNRSVEHTALRSKLDNELYFQLRHFASRSAFWFAFRLLPTMLGYLMPTRGLAVLTWAGTVGSFLVLKRSARRRANWFSSLER